MRTHYFEFDFIHKGKTIPATCYVYYHEKNDAAWFYDYPMYRVAINNHKLDPDVFIYHEVNRDDKRFFWYPLPDWKGEIAKSIGEYLESFDYRRSEYEVVKKPFWAK